MTQEYIERPTGDEYRDSTAYGYEELGNPGVIHFYKKYKPQISRGMLTLYHHIHHHLSTQTFETIKAKGIYDQKPYKEIEFHILDLDPNDIRIVCDRETKKLHYVSQPTYIDTDAMACFDISKEDYNVMSSEITRQLRARGLYIVHISKDNMQAVGIKNGRLQLIITDLGNRIPDFCYSNIPRAKIEIPGRDKNIPSKYLYQTLAYEEKFANLDKNTTTQ